MKKIILEDKECLINDELYEIFSLLIKYSEGYDLRFGQILNNLGITEFEEKDIKKIDINKIYLCRDIFYDRNIDIKNRILNTNYNRI